MIVEASTPSILEIFSGSAGIGRCRATASAGAAVWLALRLLLVCGDGLVRVAIRLLLPGPGLLQEIWLLS
jgi:hypothetical protein